jgi:glyoxylase-like metal-dependent hydrolase (beta-lactamase superfamily II)
MKGHLAAAAALALYAVAAQAGTWPILDSAAKSLGVGRIQSIEYQAHGRYYQFTQAPAPDLPWPPFDVDGYAATLDFARSAVHAKYHRVQVPQPGRLRPPAEQTMDQFALNGVSWNLTPAPSAMPTNLAERNAELWASPQGFVKAALAHKARVWKDKQGWWAKFRLGACEYSGNFTDAGDVRAVFTSIDSPVLGDTSIEFKYSDYQDFDGVRFPAHIERRIARFPWYDLTVSDVRINSAPAFDVPAQIAANPVPSVAGIEVTELAPGLLVFGGGTHNSVIVEQGAGIVVIEAPLNEQRSEAVIGKVRVLFPGKAITAVVNTHAHFDHAGGLRTYVDEGIPVVTLERNAAYYQKAWAVPRTLNPDRLAKSGRQPKFQTFTDRLRLDDPVHPLELYAIQGSGHNDVMAMVYLPRDRVLVEADVWTPTPAGAPPPTVVNPLWVNLYDNVRRLNLDVQRVAPLHGGVQDFATLRAAVAAH